VQADVARTILCDYHTRCMRMVQGTAPATRCLTCIRASLPFSGHALCGFPWHATYQPLLLISCRAAAS